MPNRLLFALSGFGLCLGLFAAWYLNQPSSAQAPVFNPAPNPYARGIYATGIIESSQANGQNINLYPEVAGTVLRIAVQEGDSVKAGTPLLQLDDSVQRASSGQLQAQAQAADAVLAALRAQPRPEALAVARAQLELADANLHTLRDQYEKQKRSHDIDRRSVSRDAFDNARNAYESARANLELAQKQYDLTRAGAWRYDIANQQRQAQALHKAAEAAAALLSKYTVRAPMDGVVLSLNAAQGSYISPQGVYGSYTQGLLPAIVMGASQDYFNVRCYIDEILISRLPPPDRMSAEMYVRGSDIHLPLQFVRVQPYVTPKISLSDQRQERVDLRVLPVIFRFARRDGLRLYPGQMVDVYLGQADPGKKAAGPQELGPKAGRQ